MKQAKPILHGRDHQPSGADPIAPALPSGTVEQAILDTIPGAYYKVPETTGDWQDSSGADRDAAYNDPGGGNTPIRGAAAILNEDDGSLCVTVNGPTPAAALTDTAVGLVTDAFFDFSGNSPFTVSALIRPTALPAGTFSMGVLGNTSDASPGGITGWGLFVLSAARDPDGDTEGGKPAFIRSVLPGTGEGEAIAYRTSPLVAGQWVRLTGVYDGTNTGLYLDNEPADGFHSGFGTTNPSLPSSTTFRFGAARAGEGTGGTYAPFQGDLDSIIVWDRALSADEVTAITVAGEDTAGLVLGIDDEGNFGWVQPKVEVTVNGEEQTGATTPLPMPLPLPPPDDSGPDADDWMLEQPFTWNGGEFEVQPNKWTTIPFSSPLMERQSNVTGGSTTWFELDWDDPAAAGWIDPATPRVITIPHDMPFDIGNYAWMQICLKLEIPPVEDEIFMEGDVTRGSHRGLRVFETTHQKSVLEAFDWRGGAGSGHGGADLWRDESAHGLTSDGELFAWGDPGGEHSGEHGNIMYVPNSGAGYSLPGLDWLPGHASGNPTLKKGMRLVPQVWHNATVPITCDCSGSWPYRPHFLFATPGLRAWGSPWSDWPTAD